MIGDLSDRMLSRAVGALRKSNPCLSHEEQACFVGRYAAALCKVEAVCREASVLVLLTNGVPPPLTFESTLHCEIKAFSRGQSSTTSAVDTDDKKTVTAPH